MPTKNKNIISLSVMEDLAARKGLEIDREAGMLRNVAVITKGAALGHAFHVDEVMLQQVADGINKSGKGLESRITHPELEGGFFGMDDILRTVGRISNAKVQGSVVRGDIKLGDYAERIPGLGDVKNFLLDVAEEDPEAIGMSIVFEMDEPDMENVKKDLPAARVKQMLNVDFVGTPAANKRGLLSALTNSQQTQRTHSNKGDKTQMNDKLKKYLISLGMPAEATGEEAQTFLSNLEGDEKEIADGLTEKKTAVTASQTKQDPASTATNDPATDPADAKAAMAKAAKEAAVLERKRVAEITNLGAMSSVPQDEIQKAIDNDMDLATFQAVALKFALATKAPITGIAVGDDLNKSTIVEAISDAIMMKKGIRNYEYEEDGTFKLDASGQRVLKKPHDRAKQFRYASLVDMGKALFAANGFSCDGMSKPAIADLMLFGRTRGMDVRYLSMSTSDFDYILANVANKAMLLAYNEAPSTYEIWAKRNTAPDYKTIAKMQLSEVATPTKVPEGGSIKYGTLSESRETYAIADYATGVLFTHQAIVNDDLGAFDDIQRKLGFAAKRLKNATCVAILTANAALADSLTLFNAYSANEAYTGGAPSTDTIGAGRTAIMTATGLAGAAIIGVPPRYLLHPATLHPTVWPLLESPVNPAATYGQASNYVRSLNLIGVEEPTLDANSTTGWYLLCDPNQVDTVEYGELEGAETPQIDTTIDPDSRGVKIGMWVSFAAKAMGRSGMYRNVGSGGSATTSTTA